MKKIKFRTSGTCSSFIEADIIDDTVHNVQFTGGCSGNLKAISLLIEGEKVDTVISKLKGVRCGFRHTSCADQLATALEKSKLPL